jgi:hypothetical protein
LGLSDAQSLNFYTAVQTFNQTLNRQVGAQIVSDADAQAYINRVYTAGGTLTNTEANAVNQLTIDMKAAGIWTAMKAVYPMVGSSAAACAQNLRSSSYTGTFSSGWTFSSTGATPNGTSAFCDTNLPNNTMSQNSMTMCTYLRTDNTITTGDLGVWNSGFGSIIYSRNGLGNFRGINNATGANFVDVSVPNSLGFFLNKRTSSTQIVLQRNSTQTTGSSNSENLLTSNFIIARMGNFGGEYSNRETAFVGIGDGITDTQATDFYTCVQTFQTTLSRQV